MGMTGGPAKERPGRELRGFTAAIRCPSTGIAVAALAKLVRGGLAVDAADVPHLLRAGAYRLGRGYDGYVAVPRIEQGRA